MDMSLVHQVWQKKSCKAHCNGAEDKADQKQNKKGWEDNISEWTGP